MLAALARTSSMLSATISTIFASSGCSRSTACLHAMLSRRAQKRGGCPVLGVAAVRSGFDEQLPGVAPLPEHEVALPDEILRHEHRAAYAEFWRRERLLGVHRRTDNESLYQMRAWKLATATATLRGMTVRRRGGKQTNTGKAYEALTQEVFQLLLAADGVKNIEVRHNVSLPGNTVSHQVDVYWRFNVGGVEYLTVVEARDRNGRVKQEQVMAFVEKINDLRERPRGLMVSRAGFQRGAREFAKRKGITIYELRPPLDSDWKNRIRYVDMAFQLVSPDIRRVEFNIDADWFRSEVARLGCNAELSDVRVEANTDSLLLVGERDERLASIVEVFDDIIDKSSPTGEAREVHRKFDSPTYVYTQHPIVRRIRLAEIVVQYAMRLSEPVNSQLDMKSLVGAVLHDVLANSQQHLQRSALRSLPSGWSLAATLGSKRPGRRLRQSH